MPEGMYHPGHAYAYPAGAPYPMQQAYPGQQGMVNGGYVVEQQPGHSVIVQRGPDGQPSITQVPGVVTSV